MFYEGIFCDQARRGRLGSPTLRTPLPTAGCHAATCRINAGLVPLGHATREIPLLMRLREGPETITAPCGQLQICLAQSNNIRGRAALETVVPRVPNACSAHAPSRCSDQRGGLHLELGAAKLIKPRPRGAPGFPLPRGGCGGRPCRSQRCWRGRGRALCSHSPCEPSVHGLGTRADAVSSAWREGLGRKGFVGAPRALLSHPPRPEFVPAGRI